MKTAKNIIIAVIAISVIIYVNFNYAFMLINGNFHVCRLELHPKINHRINAFFVKNGTLYNFKGKSIYKVDFQKKGGKYDVVFIDNDNVVTDIIHNSTTYKYYTSDYNYKVIEFTPGIIQKYEINKNSQIRIFNLIF